MGRHRSTLSAGHLAALFLALPALVAGQSDPLRALAFMSGTWCSTASPGATLIEEHYSTPSANLMLGTTRYLRDGVTVGHEFSRIEADSAGVVLTPMPSGQPAVPFRLTEIAHRRAVFENPDHDFPVRIEYERTDRELIARVLGPDGQGPEWRMSACSEDGPDGEDAHAVPEGPGGDGSEIFRRLAGSWRGTGTLARPPRRVGRPIVCSKTKPSRWSTRSPDPMDGVRSAG